MDKPFRIREYMDIPGPFNPGEFNSITDVPGATCGHSTINDGLNIRTGVTVISPAPDDIFIRPCQAGVVIGNGFGKMAGIAQIEELGMIESLIGLTNTLSVASVLQGLADYHVPNLPEGYNSINIAVGETNDGKLNDIRGCHIKPGHVSEAISNLSGNVKEGAVGAGAGTVCFGFKGGIGTSSRIVPGDDSGEDRHYTVGALVQSNYGGRLRLYGKEITDIIQPQRTQSSQRKPIENRDDMSPENGSCMIIIATDAPLSSRQLKRLAKRGLVGMTNTGSVMQNGSGDFALAFSNNETNRLNREKRGQSFYYLSDGQLNPFFEACADAVTEALYNSLTMAEQVTSNGNTVQWLGSVL